jgi:hypothetical protein
MLCNRIIKSETIKYWPVWMLVLASLDVSIGQFGCYYCTKMRKYFQGPPSTDHFCQWLTGLTKPGEVGDFFALVSMKSPNFCQKVKF